MVKRTPFDIIRIDSLGQGVSLLNDKVTFIPKTLPDERGEALLTHTKGKKVQFAEVDSLTQRSPKRIESPCPHFDHCNGCSFLHTSYEQELHHKKEAYAFLFKNFIEADQIPIIPAPERLHYRNRIQLHYTQEKFGLLNRQGIHEVPHCLLPRPEIQTKLKELYERKEKGLPLHENQERAGHFEISYNQGKLDITYNKAYSSAGFRQVNEEMGEIAAKKIADALLPFLSQQSTLIDLFGGSGHLSHFFTGERLVVDRGQQQRNEFRFHFLDLDLYSKNAHQKVEEMTHKLNWTEKEQTLILDPPRSGLKNCNKFLQNPRLKAAAYLSCNPHTQIRDIKELLSSGGWSLAEVTFFDFFPATHHLESLVILKRP